MYPPRSNKYRKKKQEKQRRQNRFWLTLNLALIIAIIALGAYYLAEERVPAGSKGSSDPSFVDEPASHSNDERDGNTNSSKAGEGSTQSSDSELNDRVRGDDAGLADEAGEVSGYDGADEAAAHNDPTATNDPTGEQNEPLQPGEEDQEAVVHLHFAGDTIFSGSIAPKLEKEGYHYPYEHVRDLFLNDDLSVLNLETPVTAGGTPAEDKSFVFKAPPKSLPPMHKAGVDAVNLANNHTLDQGVEGLLDTIKHLKESEIRYFGAGKNKSEAYSPVYVERNGITIALCGFSRVIPQADWAAGKNKPGVAVAYDSTEAVKTVEAARKEADLVIVLTHWGKERTTVLEKHQTLLAHSFIDAGADLVIGGHPHVLQGIEQYKGKWIAYSTGNFIFTKKSDAPDTWDTAVFEAKCSKEGDCQLKLLPFRTEIGQPVPLKGDEGERVLKKVENLSKNVKINKDGKVLYNN